MNAPVMLPKGTNFARLAIALAASERKLVDASALADRHWGMSSAVAAVLRSAVAAGSLGDTLWAGTLAPYKVIANEFVEALRPLTLLGKLQGMRHVPLLTRVPRATGGAAVAWVGSISPTPVSSLSLDTVTLDVLKIAGLVVTTEELARFSSPAAEQVVRNDLLAATAALSDQSFIDPSFAGVAGVSPASVSFGAPTVASTGTTATAARADLRALFNLVTTNMASPYLITDRRTAIALALMDDAGAPVFPGAGAMGGEIAGVPLLTTSSVPSPTSGSPPVPASNIILIDAAEIIVGDEGEVLIDTSNQASVQMESAPDSPVTASTVMVSLWQHNFKGWRVTRPINWQLRRPGAVAVLTGVNY